VSSSPLIANFPQQMADMASIPLTQAQAQQAQAQAQQTQTQTQGAQIANQQAALQLRLFQNALGADQGGATPDPSSSLDTGTGNSQIGSIGVGSDDISQHAFSQFAPTPTAPPPSVMRQATAFAMAGQPQAGAAIKAQWDASVAGINQNKQKAATDSYVKAQQVFTAPPGIAFSVLSRLYPDQAALLKQKYPDDSDAQLDQDTRLLSSHVGAAVHQYTDRPTTMINGVLIDQKDGVPVLGTDQVLTGLTPEDKQKAFEAANELVTLNRSDDSTIQIPRWKLIGVHSPEGYVVAADHAARTIANNASNSAPGTPTPVNRLVNPSATPPSLPASAGTTQTLPPRQNNLIGDVSPVTPTAVRMTPPGDAPGQTPALINDVTLAPSAGQTSAPPTTAPRPYSNSPIGVINYSDAPKRYLTPPPTTGVTMNEQDKATATGAGSAYGKALIDTNIQANQSVEAANAEIQGARNSQIALKTAMTGPISGKISAWQTVLGNPTWLQGMLGDAGARQVLEKTLGVDALRDIEQEAQGSSFRLGAQTMTMAVKKLAASPEMTGPAIKTMTDAMIANAQYERQKWGPDFLAYKKDPSRDVTAFSSWYSGPDKYPNQTTISGATLSGNQSSSAPVQVSSPAQARALRPGTVFITPDGRQKVR